MADDRFKVEYRKTITLTTKDVERALKAYFDAPDAQLIWEDQIFGHDARLIIELPDLPLPQERS